MRLQSKTIKTLVLASSAALAVAAFTGCAKKNATPEPTVTKTSERPTQTTPPVGAQCTDASVAAALSSGAIVDAFKCATTGDEKYAAGLATTAGKKAPFFLKDTGGKWVVVTTAQICGGAKAGLPPEIAAYCPAT